MKIFFVVGLVSILFIIPGCVDNEDPSRYPFVAIPGYGMKDYSELLSHKQPEIIYNAVCNLIRYAASIGQTLSDKKADKDSQEYAISLKTYEKIIELLSSRDSKIQAAGLKFLERMSTQYGRNHELIAPILKVRSNSPNVQYEQVFALSVISVKGSKIDQMAIKNFLQNRNWLVSRQAYLLVNQLEDEQLRMDLIKKYISTDVEFEKLLILGALKNNFSSRIFEFLTKELVSSRNQKIRHAIFDMLGAGKNKQGILDWIDKNFGVFSKEDIGHLANKYTHALSDGDVDFSSSLFIVLFDHGFAPEERFLSELDRSTKELMGKNIKIQKTMKD